MAETSQLSRVLRPSELSYLFRSIGRKLNGSAPDHVLRAEIHQIASGVLDLLTFRRYTSVNPYYRQLIPDKDIDIMVTEVTRKRKYHLNYADYVEKKEEKEKKKRRRRKYQWEIDLEKNLEKARWNAYMKNWYGPYYAGWPESHWGHRNYWCPPYGYNWHPPYSQWYFKGVPHAKPKKTVWVGKPQKSSKRGRRKSFDVENLHVHY